MAKRDARIPQITDARPSRAAELRYRERRYITMMMIRALCLIGATIVVTAHVALGWLWATVLVLGAVFLPWFAVLLANDRLPKNSHHYAPPVFEEPSKSELTAPREAPERRTIDIDYEP